MTKRKDKIRLDDPKVAETLINKQLEKYGVDVKTIPVDENDMIDGVMWYDYYSMTESEYKEFREWAWEFFRDNVSPKVSKKNFIRIIEFFISSHGLKEVKDA